MVFNLKDGSNCTLISDTNQSVFRLHDGSVVKTESVRNYKSLSQYNCMIEYDILHTLYPGEVALKKYTIVGGNGKSKIVNGLHMPDWGYPVDEHSSTVLHSVGQEVSKLHHVQKSDLVHPELLFSGNWCNRADARIAQRMNNVTGAESIVYPWLSTGTVITTGNVVLHGDLHCGNTLISDFGEVHIIDVESAMIGPVEVDIGIIMASGVLQGYDATPMVDGACSGSRMNADDITTVVSRKIASDLSWYAFRYGVDAGVSRSEVVAAAELTPAVVDQWVRGILDDAGVEY